MDPFFHTGLSISDSLKTVRKSVLIYETIIVLTWLCFKTKFVLPDIIGFVLILGAIEVVSVITFKEKK